MWWRGSTISGREVRGCLLVSTIHCCSAGINSELISTCIVYFAPIQVSLCLKIMNMFFYQIRKDIIKLAIRVDLSDKIYC